MADRHQLANYGLISGRLPSSARQKPVMSRYFQKIPCSQVRDQFAHDCAHHHPVLANHAFPTRRQIGRFCADFRVLNSWIFVSVGVRAFVDDFWRPVSASKNSVPGGRACARSPGAVAAAFRVCTALIRDLGPALQLLRIEPERLKLPAPLSRRIAEPLDADAAGQATFYGRFDKIWCNEGERDGHVDLPDATLLASAKLCDRGHATGDDIIEPTTTSRDGADQARPALELLRPDNASRCVVREQDPAGSFGWRFPPRNRERRIIRAIGSSSVPSSAVNIELHQAFVSHFQQEGLASFLIDDIRAFHNFIDFEWLLTERAQDIFSIIQHDYSLPLASATAQ